MADLRRGMKWVTRAVHNGVTQMTVGGQLIEWELDAG